MFDRPADLAAIHAAFASSVTYQRPGLATIASCPAVRSDPVADDFTGAGRSVRKILFEIRETDLVALGDQPRNADLITHAGTDYAVINVEYRGDVAAFSLTCERA